MNQICFVHLHCIKCCNGNYLFFLSTLLLALTLFHSQHFHLLSHFCDHLKLILIESLDNVYFVIKQVTLLCLQFCNKNHLSALSSLSCLFLAFVDHLKSWSNQNTSTNLEFIKNFFKLKSHFVKFWFFLFECFWPS